MEFLNYSFHFVTNAPTQAKENIFYPQIFGFKKYFHSATLAVTHCGQGLEENKRMAFCAVFLCRAAAVYQI
jgi:hypothetical protein